MPITDGVCVSGVAGQPAADAKAHLSGLLSDKQRLLRLLAGSAALVAAVVVGLMTPPGQRLLGRGEGVAMALMRQRTSLQPLTVAPEEFDEAVAQQLVMTWQVCPCATVVFAAAVCCGICWETGGPLGNRAARHDDAVRWSWFVFCRVPRPGRWVPTTPPTSWTCC